MSINHVVLGTGAVGRAIMDELVKRGETVRMVNRSGKMAEVPAGVEVIAADLYDQAKVKEVTRGAKVVYQCSQPEYFEQPFIVDSSKFEKTFGMKATPMHQAIKKTVVWYKNHPEKKWLTPYFVQ